MAVANKQGILSVRFNQDFECFTCCRNNGLRIFNVEPLVQSHYYNTDKVGTLSSADLIYRTNIMVLVGGGNILRFDERAITVYNMAASPGKKSNMSDVTFHQPVLSTRTRKDKVVVVLRNKVYVFTMLSIKHLHSFDTRDNPRGLAEMSPLGPTLVFPGLACGQVQLVNLETAQSGQTNSPNTIGAHKTELACMALNQAGTLLATASVKGTLIRVFDVASKNMLAELRRGMDPARIYCINFSLDSAYMCVSSDKGTVHIFAVKERALNKRSTFKTFGFPGQYVESEWGLANFTVPSECACICAIGANQSVFAICVDGTYHKYVFTKEGSCNREVYEVYLDLAEEMEFIDEYCRTHPTFLKKYRNPDEPLPSESPEKNDKKNDATTSTPSSPVR